ncbi:DUF2817 domain-containing protein [Bradyrhizobium monzae]|uniref:DUF2817 domain-containing protein n=1 Tax=Bradyrhizobium sp. Oc8 TaxID=2876780 RepID=UPI001F32B6F4|nr:DUF2817 domain-containing protein [Bradyrhizobium sp. Oc8]
MNLDSAKQLVPVVFSDTYLEARRKFLAAAPTSRAYRSHATGPYGEALFTDASYIGRPDAKNLLVLVSGTHGAEGYCGSAGQLLFLEAKLHEALPRSTAVLIVHALNCYGFAWDRRVTAEGCDLNRNFIDFAEPLPQNAGYEEMAEYVVPADVSEEGVRRAEAEFAAYQAAHGEQAFRQALTGGQHTRPGGMFYGGTKPTEARRTLEQIATDFDIAGRENVIIIDYHTGLGPFGYGELACEQSSGPEGYERAVKIFGSSVTSLDLGTSSSVLILGSQDAFWQRALGSRHTYVCLEFGTYQRPAGRVVLRNDHWLFMHQPKAADSDLGRQIRRATKLHFYPQASDWKEMVAWRCHMVHRQALEALNSEN